MFFKGVTLIKLLRIWDMMLDLNDPLQAVIIGAGIGFIMIYYLLRNWGRIRSEGALLSLVDNADRLLYKNLTGEALAKYQEALEKNIEWRDQRLYARVKYNEGICHSIWQS